MNKVTVTRKVPVIGQPFFEVRVNGEIVKILTFEFEQSESSPYNEERNRLEALKTAKKIEAGLKDIEELIYETPTP